MSTPADGARWLVIPNWAKYQNYANRDPVWIKTYRSQLDEPAYLALSSHLRGLLHDLRLMFARHDGQVLLSLSADDEKQRPEQKMPGTWPKDGLKMLNRHLNVNAKMRDLEALNHAGFIDFSASKPQSLSEQRASALRGSKEVEKKERPLAAGQVKSNGRPPTAYELENPHVCPVCTVRTTSERRLLEHLGNAHNLEGQAGIDVLEAGRSPAVVDAPGSRVRSPGDLA